MTTKILLTSFNTWMPHHKSNSSDDLLAQIAKIKSLPDSLTPYSLIFLRKLPVDFQLAPLQVIAKIIELQPDIIICCGMAESRSKLSLESCAMFEEEILRTNVKIEELLTNLTITEISHDAGKFVCESLYYSVLNYIYSKRLNSKCIFVHVPILTTENFQPIITDFLSILSSILIARD
ncbi:peptidase C15 [Oscillatoriales cyanobacterium USR001]|nr:peptidase C15 [Oscillatoriales cyanobacterium USR001]